MWLLKLHNEKKTPFVFAAWVFFIPFLNILCVILLFVMIGMKKEDWDSAKAEGEREERGA